MHTGRSGGSTARHSYASRTKGYQANKRGASPTRGGLSARQVGTEAKTDRSSRRPPRTTPPVVPALDAAALAKAAPSHGRHAALSRRLDGLTTRNQFSHRSHASPHVRDLVPAPKCHFSFKCCVVGDSGVGKSSLVFGSAAANADLDLRSTANRKLLAGAGGTKPGDSQVPKLGLGVNVRVRSMRCVQRCAALCQRRQGTGPLTLPACWCMRRNDRCGCTRWAQRSLKPRYAVVATVGVATAPSLSLTRTVPLVPWPAVGLSRLAVLCQRRSPLLCGRCWLHVRVRRDQRALLQARAHVGAPRSWRR